MKLEDDFEEYEDEAYAQHSAASQVRSAVVIISIFLLLTLGIVLIANRGSSKPATASTNAQVAAAEDAYTQQRLVTQSVDELISGSTLTAQDLDFWNDYSDGGHPAIASVNGDGATGDGGSSGGQDGAGSGNAGSPGNATAGGVGSEDGAVSGNAADAPENDDPATDGKHTLITYGDGREEWVDINPYLSGHGYDFSGLVYQKPFMKYYENNTRYSYTGVDISKDEEYVDFARLKRAGVDYVMLRLGQRGYVTGEITMDENFMDNYTRAREAKLDIGIYFVTSAITIEEAKEEADYCLQTVSENGITLDYPLALYTGQLGSGKSRMDGLEKMPRTNIALTFMKAVEDAGYFPLLYGDKETLIKHYSLGSMIGYEIWYSEQADIPSYPYPFVMWQYDLGGEVSGIAGGAHLNICFTDYSVR